MIEAIAIVSFSCGMLIAALVARSEEASAYASGVSDGVSAVVDGESVSIVVAVQEEKAQAPKQPRIVPTTRGPRGVA